MASINRNNHQPSTAVQNDLSKDITIQDSPQDSISDLRFNPQVDHLLAAASWDNTVRIYDINQTGVNKGVAMFRHEGPVLSCCWSPDGQTLFGAGIDKTIRLLDLLSSSQQQVPTTHIQPIRSIHSFTLNNTPILTTASWDTTLKYWDLRQRTAIATLPCQDKIYSTSIRNNSLLVIATADRNIHIIDLAKPTKIFKTLLSPLKHQTRIVQTYLDGTGFALGGIEGRCAFQYIEEKDSAKNYTFRCHRQPQTPPSSSNASNIYALNAISTAPPPRPLQHRRLRRHLPFLGQRQPDALERVPGSWGSDFRDGFQSEGGGGRWVGRGLLDGGVFLLEGVRLRYRGFIRRNII